LLLVFGIPMVGSIITAFLMPRLFAPIFLKGKRVRLSGYKDAYLPVTQNRLSIKQWFGRASLVSLLILGFIAAIVNIIDPLLFMTQVEYNEFIIETGLPQLAPPVIITLTGLIAPIAFGLFAISWIMEDAGLIHYSIPAEDEDKLYKVEPVHDSYSSYLKGYSGLSSLIFLISVFYLFWTHGGNVESAIFTLLVPIFAILQTIPGYILYVRLDKSFLTSKLPEARRLNESDLRISEA
ncbi:MAG: hypothetical protein KAU48_09385, partial [Candidatus Thorarchaeota archaeon]|nr:hypothetical protein [Candidatus Thorarchaeota archaeon]